MSSTKFNDFFAGTGVSTVPADKPSGVSIFLHGLAGSGKTSLAASATTVEGMGPVLFLDVEGRVGMALKDWGDPDNATVVPVSSWPEMAKTKRVIQAALAKGEFPYKTVVLDSMDRLQKKILDHFGQESISGNNSFLKWGEAYERLADLLEMFLMAPGVSLIAITHSTRENDEVSGGSLISPNFEGKKSLPNLPSMFDLVGYMFWEQDDEEEATEPTIVFRSQGVIAKKGSRYTPDRIKAPSMGELYASLLSDGKEKKKEKEETPKEKR